MSTTQLSLVSGCGCNMIDKRNMGMQAQLLLKQTQESESNHPCLVFQLLERLRQIIQAQEFRTNWGIIEGLTYMNKNKEGRKERGDKGRGKEGERQKKNKNKKRTKRVMQEIPWQINDNEGKHAGTGEMGQWLRAEGHLLHLQKTEVRFLSNHLANENCLQLPFHGIQCLF